MEKQGQAMELQDYNKSQDNPSQSDGKVNNLLSGVTWLVVAGVVAVITLLVAIFVVQIAILSINCPATCNATAASTGRIDGLHSTLDDQANANANSTRDINSILETTGNSTQRLMSIIDLLTNVQGTSTSNADAATGIQQVVQDLSRLQNVRVPTSCQEIRQLRPNSQSGSYVLGVADNQTCSYSAYCNMETLCGSEGGWTRLAYLNMTDTTQNCPSGLTLYQFDGVRACGRPASNIGSCASVQFPSNGISYSQVCGRVVGYQYDSPEAISNATGANRNDLNSYYVDGVSITRGSPRQHVWTLMADTVHHFCPCASVAPGNSTVVQSFVGDHYFCEAAATNGTTGRYFPNDPLWDGQGCDSSEVNCCLAPGIPWFHRDYNGTTTTDYIELRVCADERRSNEDSPVGYYEIYVK